MEGDEFGLLPASWTVFANGWPTEFDTLKTSGASVPPTALPGHFGTVADRNHANGVNILAAKRKVFRYCVFANNSKPAPQTDSGLAEFGGNDFIVSERV